MVLGYNNVRTVTVTISDPTSDATYPILRVPARTTKIEVLQAWAESDVTITGVGGTGFALTLLDYGTAGTAEAGTVGTTLGGTTSSWTAEVPRTFTIDDGTMDANDYLRVSYDETGTVAPLNITVSVMYVDGVGA